MTLETGGYEEMREALAPSAALLREVAGFAMHLDQKNAFTPTPRSAAMREIDEEQRTYRKRSIWSAPIFDTHTLGSTSLLAAGDFTEAYASLLAADKVPVFGHLAVARAALEACVVAHWLNEPSITTLERIRRGLAEKMYSAHEMRRFSGTRPRAVEVINEIKQVAASFGWKVSGNKQVAAIDGIGRPSLPRAFSELIVGDSERVLGSALWSYLSGVGHSAWWALRESVVLPPRDGLLGVNPSAFGTESGKVGAYTVCVGRALRAATSARIALMGWPDAEWTKVTARLEQMDLAIMRSIAMSRTAATQT